MTLPERASANEVRGLVHLARKRLLRSVDADRDVPGLERLFRAQHRALTARRRAPYVWAGTILVTALAVLTFRSIFSRPRHQLAYALRPARYEFSDGTVISLRTGANLQVLSANEYAPHLRLTRGEADVSVVHRADSRWDFSAGPFDVAVVGTAFELNWDPERQTFSLDLRQGAVSVTGPVLDGPLLLHAGHRVSVFLETGRVAIDLAQPSTSPPRSPSPVQVALPAMAVPQAEPSGSSAAASDAPPAPRAAPKASWRALVGRGRFAEVIMQAQAMPIAGCVSLCSAADLRALGDAARYTGRAELAERAFLRLRERFAGSPESTVAAFLLAHTYEAQHRLQLATTWYERYLSEAPSGEFSAEASAGRARTAAPH